MKKITFSIAAMALFAVTATATYAANRAEVSKAEKAEILDCWSTTTRYLNGDPADVDQQAECPGGTSGCCVKPDPTLPTGFKLFSLI